MTSVSGYYVVSAPCCGALYEKTAYSSINMSGWKRWSDGLEGGTLYDSPDYVCRCECGHFFLTNGAEELEYVRFRRFKEQLKDPQEEPVRPQTLPYVDQREAFDLVYNRAQLPGGEVEAFIRLMAWQALNDEYRVKEPDGWSGLDLEFISKFRTNMVNRNEPWRSLPTDETEALQQANLKKLIPLIESLFPKKHLLIGNAYRALGDQEKAIDRFNRVTDELPKIVDYLIKETKAGNRKVIRIDPPEWFDDLVMPEPWVNTKAGKDSIILTSKWFWFKIFGMLNQVWALIEPRADSDEVTIYWIDDNASIIKSEEYASEGKAWTALERDGYKLFEDEPDVWEIMCPPGGPYKLTQLDQV